MYECINTFYTDDVFPKKYREHEEISDSEYNDLSSFDQRNFRKARHSDNNIIGDVIDVVGIVESLFSYNDSPSIESDNSSDSSLSDYSGGDSGGGGSGSDW